MLQRNRASAGWGGRFRSGLPQSCARLVVQEPALAIDAAAKACQRSVSANDAVARHDDHQRVASVRGTHGTYGLRLVNAACELCVADRLAKRNGFQRVPHATLEVGAARLERKIERASCRERVEISVVAGVLKKKR